MGGVQTKRGPQNLKEQLLNITINSGKVSSALSEITWNDVFKLSLSHFSIFLVLCAVCLYSSCSLGLALSFGISASISGLDCWFRSLIFLLTYSFDKYSKY